MNKKASKQQNCLEPFAVADKLHSTAIHLLRTLRLQDDASGVGPARLSALSILVFVGPKSLGELAQMEQVRPPTMSRIVDGLEADGFARRETNKEDARGIRIEATPKGIKLLNDARTRRVNDLAVRLGSLKEEDRECILEASQLIGIILQEKTD